MFMYSWDYTINHNENEDENEKNRSYGHNINRPRPRHGQKYSKYKKCLSMMMLICIKHHPSNIWLIRFQCTLSKLLNGWSNGQFFSFKVLALFLIHVTIRCGDWQKKDKKEKQKKCQRRKAWFQGPSTKIFETHLQQNVFTRFQSWR